MRIRTASALIFMLLLGCDLDPFGLQRRHVVGPYQLEQWEDNATYYLVRSGYAVDGGGVLAGAVLQLGWNDRYIVAERKAASGGDVAWMIVDAGSGQIIGPIPELEIRRRPEVVGIRFISAEEAWRRLR
jgi:hypothetical protein